MPRSSLEVADIFRDPKVFHGVLLGGTPMLAM